MQRFCDQYNLEAGAGGYERATHYALRHDHAVTVVSDRMQELWTGVEVAYSHPYFYDARLLGRG